MAKLISISPDNSLGKAGEVDITTEKEIQDIVANAKHSYQTWSKTNVEKRKEYLEKLFSALQDKQTELAQLESREMGMPVEELWPDTNKKF